MVQYFVLHFTACIAVLGSVAECNSSENECIENKTRSENQCIENKTRSENECIENETCSQKPYTENATQNNINKNNNIIIFSSSSMTLIYPEEREDG